jgi:hypothetical protein
VAANSPHALVSGRGTKPGKPPDSEVTLTQEQVRAIADRVYSMLLRDLKQEWERGRIAVQKSERLRGGW